MKSVRSPKKYYIETFGCQANEADSNRLCGILETVGLERSVCLEDADIFIVNSCSVRQKSEDKVYGLARKLKTLPKKPFVVLGGCMVGSVQGSRVLYPFEELKERTPWVDLYLNSDDLPTLPKHLVKEGFIDTYLPLDLSDRGYVPDDKSRGYVNISYGCDNFCTYCVVPYSRGPEISRTKEEILKNVKHLLDKGINEITLCGQNVNSWGLSLEQKRKIRIGDDTELPFADLLREVHGLAGIKLLSFISSNPFDFTQDLVDVLKLPKIDNYLHIAVQSGNNDVLARMNRHHTIEDFYDLIDRIKKAKPTVRLGTDIIVGFPGETRDQFMDTVRLFQKIQFKVAFISMYSERVGTAAQRMYKDDVSLQEKKWRHAYLTRVWKGSLKR